MRRATSSTARLRLLNLGMGRMVSKAKGQHRLHPVGTQRAQPETDALKLVGLRPVNPANPVPAGSHLMSKGDPVDAAHEPRLCDVRLFLTKSGPFHRACLREVRGQPDGRNPDDLSAH